MPLVALVARFENVKGHEYFLDAARLIMDAIPNAHFAIAGENVFSVSKVQPFNTKMQTPGSEAAVTFASEGTVEVRCAIHPCPTPIRAAHGRVTPCALD